MWAEAVIGANYGDEGKGLITNHLVTEGPRTLVIRANGGAQAGHTVTMPDGRRHVFSHIGSGFLAGAATYLGRQFVCNPLVFFKELADLSLIGDVINLGIHVDRRCVVSTRWDLIINQIVEHYRAGARHGSVGIGFGETIERNLHPEFAFTVDDIFELNALTPKLRRIQTEWVPMRMAQLVGPEWKKLIPATFVSALLDEHIFHMNVADLRDFYHYLILCDPTVLKSFEQIIFEGAQGLGLDQDRGAFPYVTRSNTGLKNIVDVCCEAEITDLTVNYLTRSYLTRHGAGPLEGEAPSLPYVTVVDPTNISNDWQGSLRIAPLDVGKLSWRINADLSDVSASLSVHPRIVVTCLDQLIDESMALTFGDETLLYEMYTGLETISKSLGFPHRFLGFGNSSDRVLAFP